MENRVISDQSLIKPLSQRSQNLCSSFDVYEKRMADKSLSEWLDGADVCQIMGIAPRTLQSYRNSGLISFSSFGGKLFYKPEDVQKVIDYKKLKK